MGVAPADPSQFSAPEWRTVLSTGGTGRRRRARRRRGRPGGESDVVPCPLPAWPAQDGPRRGAIGAIVVSDARLGEAEHRERRFRERQFRGDSRVLQRWPSPARRMAPRTRRHGEEQGRESPLRTSILTRRESEGPLQEQCS